MQISMFCGLERFKCKSNGKNTNSLTKAKANASERVKAKLANNYNK